MRPLAARILTSVAVYLAILIIVSVLTPARIYQPGEPQCFDDWCLAIERTELDHNLLRIHLEVISYARRVTQRELGVKLYLMDNSGRTYEPQLEFGQPIDTAVAAGDRFTTGRVFPPAPGAENLALIIQHGGPGILIIADRASLFHRRSRMLLPAPTQ